MSYKSARFVIAAGVLLPCAALAQSTSPPAQPADAAQSAADTAGKKEAAAVNRAASIQTVEVKGKNNYDARRDDTASKTVLNTDEIRKYGDDNIYDGLCCTNRPISGRGAARVN